jgi:hypothetical protein
MKKKVQDALYKDLINGRRHRSAGYTLWIGHDIGNVYFFYLCRNSLLNVLSIGKKRNKTLKETRFIPGANLHKNTGNQHAALSADVTSSVVKFIQQKGVEEGEVGATHIIRSLTGHELQYEEKGAADLPSSMAR